MQAELSRLRAELEEKTEACKRWEAGFLADSGRMMEMKSRAENAEAELAKLKSAIDRNAVFLAWNQEMIDRHDAGVRAKAFREAEAHANEGTGAVGSMWLGMRACEEEGMTK
ncbi:MAG: hypothetical protein KJ954_14375 [Alphaproteobacteria bacterium]|nr:hypothetical protein [Alphaproteobacteria bacterium]